MGLSDIFHGLSVKDPRPCAPAVSGKLTTKQFIRNRYQTGPNFGALFVQEKWIDNSLFNPDNDTGGSELAALKSWGKKAKIDELREKWESHWDQFITDDDWKLLEDSGVTCIRLPIGFYSLGDKSLLKHTPFADYAGVYKNSWDFIVKIIDKAQKHRIGVLIDFHALPGGANGDEHSGTSSGKAELWSSSKFREGAIETYIEFICLLGDESDAIQQNVVALQLVNEAPWGESKCSGFYLDAAAKIRSTNKIGKEIPLVISDSWDCNNCASEIAKWNEKVGDSGFIVDTHVYRTFSDEDKGKSAEQHISEASNAVSFQGEADVYVGEWSCCLDEETWKKSHGDRGQQEADFGKAEISNFAQLAGNFFWTFKFGQGIGGSWDWREMSKKGVIVPPLQPGQGNLEDSLKQALEGHKNYWSGQNSKVDWEFWRFEDGYRQGWQDAEEFANFHGSRLGRIVALSKARSAEHVKEKGDSDKEFSYKQAYEQAVHARNSL